MENDSPNPEDRRHRILLFLRAPRVPSGPTHHEPSFSTTRFSFRFHFLTQPYLLCSDLSPNSPLVFHGEDAGRRSSLRRQFTMLPAKQPPSFPHTVVPATAILGNAAQALPFSFLSLPSTDMGVVAGGKRTARCYQRWDKGSTVAAAADWCSCYDGALHALNAATAALSGILALHSEVALFFVRCAPQLDLDRGGKGWRSSDSWAASLADVERHGRAALHRLWSASSCLDFCLLGALGGGSPSSSLQEAREVMGRAIADAREARDSGDHLWHAAAREFFHSSTVLHDASST